MGGCCAETRVDSPDKCASVACRWNAAAQAAADFGASVHLSVYRLNRAAPRVVGTTATPRLNHVQCFAPRFTPPPRHHFDTSALCRLSTLNTSRTLSALSTGRAPSLQPEARSLTPQARSPKPEA